MTTPTILSIPKEYKITLTALTILLSKYSTNKNPLLLRYINKDKMMLIIQEGPFAGSSFYDIGAKVAQCVCFEWCIYLERILNDIEKPELETRAEDLELEIV